MTEPIKEEGVKVTAEDLKELGIKEPARDLTAEQDARVIPFVSSLLRNLAAHDFKFTKDKKVAVDKEEDESYNLFYSQRFMPEAMERNLRLNDMGYTFQLVKKTIEMLQNRSSQPDDEMRCVPCAIEILGKLGEQPSLMLVNGEEDGEKRADLYTEFYNDIVVPAFMKHEIAYNEFNQVFAVMSTMIAVLEHKTGVTLDSARDLADTKLWGVSDPSEISIRQLHEVCLRKSGDNDSTTK